LFWYHQGQLSLCPYAVRAFSIVSATTLFVLAADNVARIVSVEDWHIVTRGQGGIFLDGPLIVKVTALAHTTLDADGNAQLWFRPEARQIWMSLRKDVPMLLRGHFAAGDAHKYDEMKADLNGYVHVVSREFQQTKALSNLFANRFADAAAVLINETSEESLVFNGALSGLIIACEEPIGERLMIHLKSVAVSLFLKEDYEKGATFLRIARLDKLAAEYLLGYGQLELALKFIRGLSGAVKNEMLRRLGARLMQARRLFEALLTFVSCGEFQMALHLMVELGMVVDAFFLKKYIVGKDWLKQANPDLAKLAPEMLGLIELSAKIDVDFASWAGDIGVDPRDMKTLLS
jgi:hypothetical protein